MDEQLRFGNVLIDLPAYAAFVNDHRVELTYIQFQLLLELAQHPRRVVLRRELLEAVWGEGDAKHDRKLDVQVSRLRRKLREARPWAIETIRKRGYVWQPAAG